MPLTHDTDARVRILDEPGTGVACDFDDHDLEMYVVSVQRPEDQTEETRRATAPRVDGDSLRAWKYGAGVLSAVIDVHGETWGHAEARWQTKRAIYTARTHYLIEVILDGATYRYRAERPYSVLPTDATSTELGHKVQTYLVRWRVQPDYTVTTS